MLAILKLFQSVCLYSCICSLAVQLGKRYPYVAPAMKLESVKGLKEEEETELLNLLGSRARSLARIGSVMVCELVQLCEEYLLSHNKDPALAKMSAWEQMKAREEEERRTAQEKEDNMHLIFEVTKRTETSSSKQETRPDDSNAEKIKIELARQMEALDIAEEGRRKLRKTELNGHNEDDEDEFNDENILNDDDYGEEEDDFDMYCTGPSNLTFSSRYESDFVEMGLLGRGGGGEVVKVRNRLDRRICK